MADKTLLMVEDDVLVRRALGRALGGSFELTFAETAEEALDRLQDGERFDVILADYGLVGMNGHEMYDRLCAMSLDEAGRFFILTGRDTDPADPFAVALGGRYLHKPIVPRLLLEVLLRFVDAHGRVTPPAAA